MSPSCAKTCTLDLHQCAVYSLTMAIADYVSLYGQGDDFIKAFLTWSWMTEDAVKIIELYNNMPEKLKKKGDHPSKIDLKKSKKKTVIKRKKTEEKIYQRFQLAANQLETAIMLFLTNTDKLSAITLTVAADVVFCELVNREGKKNFTDLLCEQEGGKISRKEVGRGVNDLLRINALKHFDNGDDEYIDLDIDECGVATILKALANYNMLEGKNDKLILAFRCWVKMNLDPKKYNLYFNDTQKK